MLIDDRPPQRECGSGFSVLLDAIEAVSDNEVAISVTISDRVDGDLTVLADLGVHVMHHPDAVLSDLEGLLNRVLISAPIRPLATRRWCHRHRPLWPTLPKRFSIVGCGTLDLFAIPRRGSGERQRCSSRGSSNARSRGGRRDHLRLGGATMSSLSCRTLPIRVVRPVVSGVAPTPAAFSERCNLLLTPGWMAGDGSPNVDALRWFVSEVLPRLLDVCPESSFQ